MDTQQPQKKREKEGEEEKPKQKENESQSTPTITSSPPSPSSSPSHEFSFTISLHPSSMVPEKPKSSPPSFAIDLSPADDIFFHGHLLPLHLLSHLPISARSSTNSFESYSLPIKDILEDKKPNDGNNNYGGTNEGKGRSKAKYFSLFGLTRWRKGVEEAKKEEDMEKKRKVRFNVSHILKRYLKIIHPLVAFKGGRSENRDFQRQPYSFSGNLSWKKKQDQWRGRRGEFSAPASMWTSPTNSGPLVRTETPPNNNDSTMEELQSAIQAAIAHCKNSFAMEEKFKC